MASREEIINQEARELWRAVRNEPPPEVNGSVLLEMILKGMSIDGYDRLRSRHLRDSQITRPDPDARC